MSDHNQRPDWRDRLRWAVDRSERTQIAIAVDAGITPRTLSRILNDVYANPQFDVVVRLARVLDVRVGWLAGEPDGLTLSREDGRRVRAGIALLDRIIGKGSDQVS